MLNLQRSDFNQQFWKLLQVLRKTVLQPLLVQSSNYLFVKQFSQFECWFAEKFGFEIAKFIVFLVDNDNKQPKQINQSF